VFASGDEHELDGSRDLKTVVQDVGKTLVGNLYTRFVEVDKRYDFRNVGKRLVKAPKIYLRDTGLLHHLQNISTHDQLIAHPIRGASWETFVIEDVLRREQLAHPDSQAYFWRTAAGAEIDLLIERVDQRIGVEVKTARGDHPRAVRALSEALIDVDAHRGWIIDQGAGVNRVADRVARAGFAEVQSGTPG